MLISSKYRSDGDVLLPCSQFLLFLGYKESNEELQAQLVSKSLEEGRTLLNHANNNSLAAEFEAMSENEVSLGDKTTSSWLAGVVSWSCQINIK